MVLASRTQHMLDDIQKLMVVSEDEIIQRGIAQATTNRIIELRQRIGALSEQYKNIENLENQIHSQGVSADDHTAYTDLLEWRTAYSELRQLTQFLKKE